MASAGYLTSIFIDGAPLDFTDAATTNSDKIYVINDVIKNVFDLDTVIIVKKDGVVVNSGFIIDRLFGRIIFENTQTGVITVSGRYLPRLRLGTATAYGLERTVEILNTTAMGNGAFSTYTTGIKDVTCTLSRFHVVNDAFLNVSKGRKRFLLEINPDADDEMRGFFIIDSEKTSSSIHDLISQELGFKLSPIDNNQFSQRSRL